MKQFSQYRSTSYNITFFGNMNFRAIFGWRGFLMTFDFGSCIRSTENRDCQPMLRISVILLQ